MPLLAELALVLVALLIILIVVAAAGALFARVLGFPGFARAEGLERAGLALLVGLTALPISIDLAGRFGPTAMAGCALALALAGVPTLAPALRGPLPAGARLGLAVAALWIVVSTAVMLPWPDAAGGLVNSVFALDYVKHAETTAAVAGAGTPPWNPTFFTPGVHAAYYYFFYTLTATTALLGAPLGLEPRHAAYAAAGMAAFALYALAEQLWRRSGADEAMGVPAPRRPVVGWLIALLLVTGLDILPVARFALNGGLDALPHDPEVWNEQVTAWTLSVLWTPHHVAGLVAAFVGLLALAGPTPADARRVALAGLAFASLAGLSVYVALTAAVLAALWLVALLLWRRPADALRLVVAGVLALILAAPWLMTLLGTYGGGGEAPIAFAIRGGALMPQGLDNPLLRVPLQLFTMLAAYAVEFGVFLVGAWAFWARAGRAGATNDVARLLVAGALASFLVGSFLRSTVLYNDLGWRAMLFAQMASLVWTLSAFRAGLLRDRAGPWMAAWACLILGYMPLVYAFVQARRFPRQDALARAVNHDERAAWSWANAHLPRGAAVQAHANTERAYNFGLYSRNPAWIADHHVGRLFGASEQAVLARIGETISLFEKQETPLATVRAFAARNGVAAIVVTAADPVFAAPGAWTAQARPAFAAPHARVYLTQDIADAKP